MADEEKAELKAQIEQLSNDNYVLKTAFITQQAQIEKMKTCLNCKHWLSGAYCELTLICKNRNRWELTEE